MCVTLTPAAAKFMGRMIRFGGAGANAGFRLSVKPGGCSGFESSFTIEAAAKPGDAVIEQEGVRLFLPEASCALLRGCTIDFRDSRLEGGLSFHHPAGPRACGCGAGLGAAVAGPVPVAVFCPGACSKA
ncbi:MAG: iron-sulfur cluster assembly accessory protein [Betaproteobacteria bacterium]|nr:iron-sulfur cluster assembly accessory protein [Betaproteobacteria bacterium]